MKKNSEKKESSKYDAWGFRAFVGAVIVSVIGVLLAGLWLGGSPAQERARRIDAARDKSLQSISNAIDQYYNTNARLPDDLDTLVRARETYWVDSITDPESGEPYEYRIRTDTTYELCATFTTDSTVSDPRLTDPYAPPDNRFWEHGPERTCFTITAIMFPK